MTFQSSFPHTNLRERKQNFCRIVPCVFCVFFFLHSFIRMLFQLQGMFRQQLGHSDSVFLQNAVLKMFWAVFTLTTCGRVFTEASVVLMPQLRSKRRPLCYSRSQTTAGKQEKCVQATELVRPEAAMISDQSATRYQQIYAAQISGTDPAPEKKNSCVCFC